MKAHKLGDMHTTLYPMWNLCANTDILSHEKSYPLNSIKGYSEICNMKQVVLHNYISQSRFSEVVSILNVLLSDHPV